MAYPPPPKRVAIPIELQWNLPWHLDCFQGITDFGKDHGWECIVDPYLDGPTGDGDLSSYDGAVGRIDSPGALRLKDLGVPVVTMIKHIVETGAHSVMVDSYTGARLAAEHLIANGYRRFGQVTNQPKYPAYLNSIVHAFDQGITDAGFATPAMIAVELNEADGNRTSKESLQTLRQWIRSQDKPIGLFVYVFDTARYLAQICAQIGLRVPEDVGIVVRDADTMNITRISPTLSAIDFDFWEQGYQAAAVLDRLMQGERVEPRHKLVVPRRIVIRESSDVFVCADELVSNAMRHIAEHSRQTLQVEEVADALNVSRRTLDRRFEEVLGKTVSQEIARLRMKQLERMIVETELPMVKIAELCGFGSASHFTQFFSKHAGMTPSAYRKSHHTSNTAMPNA